MGQVTVTLNGRTYRLRCGDGEEERLLSVAGHVRGHVERLTAEHGQIGDERLILMAAIMISDELFELRDATVGLAGSRSPEQQSASPHSVPRPPAAAHRPPPPPHPVATGPAPQPPPASIAAPSPPAMTPSAPAHPPIPSAARPPGPIQPLIPRPTAPPQPVDQRLAERELPQISVRPAATVPPNPATPLPPAGPAPAPLPTGGARTLEHLDATALMKGLEKKAGRV